MQKAKERKHNLWQESIMSLSFQQCMATWFQQAMLPAQKQFMFPCVQGAMAHTFAVSMETFLHGAIVCSLHVNYHRILQPGHCGNWLRCGQFVARHSPRRAAALASGKPLSYACGMEEQQPTFLQSTSCCSPCPKTSGRLWS